MLNSPYPNARKSFSDELMGYFSSFVNLGITPKKTEYNGQLRKLISENSYGKPSSIPKPVVKYIINHQQTFHLISSYYGFEKCFVILMSMYSKKEDLNPKKLWAAAEFASHCGLYGLENHADSPLSKKASHLERIATASF